MCHTYPKCKLGQSSALILREYEIKNLGTRDMSRIDLVSKNLLEKVL